jgi:ribosomal protein S8E
MRERFEKVNRNIYARPSNSEKNKEASSAQKLAQAPEYHECPRTSDGQREAKKFAAQPVPQEPKVQEREVRSTDFVGKDSDARARRYEKDKAFLKELWKK